MKTDNRKIGIHDFPHLGHFTITANYAQYETTEPTNIFLDEAGVAASYWKECISRSGLIHGQKEHLVVIPLDNKLKAMGWHLVSMGDLNTCILSEVCVLRPVLVIGAQRFIVMHNHPSGNPLPSLADIRATARLNQASKVLGVKLLDHIVIGDHTGKYFSFAGESPVFQSSSSICDDAPSNIIPFPAMCSL